MCVDTIRPKKPTQLTHDALRRIALRMVYTGFTHPYPQFRQSRLTDFACKLHTVIRYDGLWFPVNFDVIVNHTMCYESGSSLLYR